MHAPLSATCPEMVPLFAAVPDEDGAAGRLGTASSTTILCTLCCRRNGAESHLDEDSLGRLCEICRRDLVRFIQLLIDSVVELRRIDGKALVRILRALLSVGAR